ncbi:hypothetical protein HOK09_00180 [Candidatus Woesearchaeota archaeon]|nr:hypothetical protein [Candidatus Woesearchaeota archaeon]
MQIKITTQQENPLLHRVEVSGDISFDKSTPSNKEVATWLAGEFKKNVQQVIVKNIYTAFGENKAQFSAVVYDSIEAKDKNEMLTKHLKKKLDEEKKKAEEVKKAELESKKKAEEEAKAAAEVKEEAPVEEKAEVKKAEKPVVEEPAKEEGSK